ncbi:Nn.00g046650.m01.CDS01 [Neocucurbitaria sp. VM-36]
MRFTASITTLVLTASTALAAATIVTNKCDFDVWVTSVSTTTGETKKITPTSSYTEGQYFDGTGTAIKVTRSENGLWQNKPVLTFAYSYTKGGPIYYDLSSHSGFDFWGKKLTIKGEQGKGAEEVTWDGTPKPNHTAAYWGETDLTLTLCA